MKFNISDEFGRKKLMARVDYLLAKGLREKNVIVELTDKSQRSNLQNNYLHLIISCLALHIGLPEKETKEEIYKAKVNPDLFVSYKSVEGLGTVRELRSSASLTTSEMSLSIDRFRDFASRELGVYLPAPNEEEMLRQLAVEIDQYQNRLYL